MKLLSENFLLENEMARTLFHKYAQAMPIIDYHCHLNPAEIYENKNYPNMTRIWINDDSYGDHYKWRLMRANGVEEELITGSGDDYEKFLAFAETIEKAVGNPIYEWTHLELRRFFHIEDILSRKTAAEIWEKGNALLQTEAFKPRSLIKNSNVKAVCTTDDPASDLNYHQLIQKSEKQNGFKVLPALRPDKLMAIRSDNFRAYLEELGTAAGHAISSFQDIIKAMHQRFEFFSSLGGRLSDHSLSTYYFAEADTKTLDSIVAKGLAGEAISDTEYHQYITMLFENLMALNNEFDWTMQFHINVNRNINAPMFTKVGADAGFDVMGTQPDIAHELLKLFSRVSEQDNIPKTIVYSLNPNDWLMLTTMTGAFQGKGKQRLQLGPGWWFNDTAEGMERQLEIFAQQSLLPNFVGMQTDSRSFLSYSRHEYFRRVLCNFIGKLSEQGRVPDDEAYLGQIVQDISYNNAHDYFKFFG